MCNALIDSISCCTGHVVLSLKGQTIPSNGTGVVLFDDIGGYLGPEDGLLCTSNISEHTAQL